MPGSSKKKVPLTVLGSRQRRGGGGVISASVVPHRQIATHMGEGAVLMVSLKRQPSTALPQALTCVGHGRVPKQCFGVLFSSERSNH